MNTIAQRMCEDATGCRENPSGLGTFYADDGAVLTVKEAKATIRRGDSVEVPNAGASSYDSIFRLLGFSKVETVETSSSAGDWAFAVKQGRVWRPAFQENRYPYHGFRYSLGAECFETLTSCESFMCNG